MRSSATRVKRSTSVADGVNGGPLPFKPMPVRPIKFVVSTTSVSPSKRPRASPMYILIARRRAARPSSGTMRVSWIIS